MAGHGVGKQIDLGVKSTLTEADIRNLESRFPVLEGYSYRLPTPQESDIRRVSNGAVVFRAALELGLRFPMSNFGASFLKTHRISPG